MICGVGLECKIVFWCGKADGLTYLQKYGNIIEFGYG